MAEFCRQCSLSVLGEDFGDLSGLLSEEESRSGLCVAVLCEGCGPTCVDHEGRCLGGCLTEEHGPAPWDRGPGETTESHPSGEESREAGDEVRGPWDDGPVVVGDWTRRRGPGGEGR